MWDANISLERLIEENKEQYCEALEQSSVGWHEGKHDPWPYINYLFFIIKSAYKKFENRLGQIKGPREAKTQMIEAAIGKFRGSFSLSQLEGACPGGGPRYGSHDSSQPQEIKMVECLGRGPGAAWRKEVIPS